MKLFMSKKERELIKKLKEEEKDLDENLPDEKINFIDLLFDKVDESELEEYLTESDKLELLASKKEEKKLIIIASGLIISVLTLTIAFLFIFNYKIKSDLLKTTLPKMKEYYKNKYDKNLDYYSLDYLCEDQDNCSNIAYLTTKENRHIMMIDNNQVGDDISINVVVNEYNDYLHNRLAYLDIIDNNPILSYKDYYLDYNIHYDYIKCLPDGQTFADLLKDRKLSVTDILFYQGDYDYNLVMKYLNNFSDESILYLVKVSKGLPNNLTVISKKNHYSFNITATLPLNKDITYYELDRSKNSVSSLLVKKVNKDDISTLDKYKIDNAYGIVLEKSYNQEKLPSYFFIKLDNISFNASNIYEFSVFNYNDEYRELESKEYETIITYQSGNSTYIIGSSSIGIGLIRQTDNIFCKIGLCS